MVRAQHSLLVLLLPERAWVTVGFFTCRLSPLGRMTGYLTACRFASRETPLVALIFFSLLAVEAHAQGCDCSRPKRHAGQ